MATEPVFSVNDIHSLLNCTITRRVESPGSLAGLRRAVVRVRDSGSSLSVAGGRHAMDGQLFPSDGILLDTNRLDRIIGLDPERGLVKVEAGIL